MFNAKMNFWSKKIAFYGFGQSICMFLIIKAYIQRKVKKLVNAAQLGAQNYN